MEKPFDVRRSQCHNAQHEHGNQARIRNGCAHYFGNLGGFPGGPVVGDKLGGCRTDAQIEQPIILDQRK